MVAPLLVHAPHNGETSILLIFLTKQNKQTLELAIVNEAHEEQGWGAGVKFSVCCWDPWPSEKDKYLRVMAPARVVLLD